MGEPSHLTIVRTHARPWSPSSSGMPSNSRNTAIGYLAMTSSTSSARGRPASTPNSRRATGTTRSVYRALAAGLKNRFWTRRSRPCSGPFCAIMEPAIGPTP
jgi:hypothetical protein